MNGAFPACQCGLKPQQNHQVAELCVQNNVSFIDLEWKAFDNIWVKTTCLNMYKLLIVKYCN